MCMNVTVACMCMCNLHVPGVHRGEKRAPDLLELELDSWEVPHMCWELNLGSLQELRFIMSHLLNNLGGDRKIENLYIL